MKEILLKTGIINTLSAGIGFLTNYLIVRWMGLEIFGELSIAVAVIALGTIIFSVLPSNFAIFQLQDNTSFQGTYLSYICISIFVFAIYLWASSYFGFTKLHPMIALLYGIPIGLQLYFDTTTQAKNKSLYYFNVLCIVAICKLIFVFVAKTTGMLVDLETLMLIIAIPPAIIFGYLFLQALIVHASIIQFKGLETYFKTNFNSFKPYFLNGFIKRMREQSIILLFSPLVSKEIIGIFSLFVKIDQFIYGLSRNIEAFFMHRKNIEKHKFSFNKHFFVTAVALQVLYIMLGLPYMKIMTGSYYYTLIILQSFLVYPHIKFLLARAELLSQYKNKEANISESLYILFAITVCAFAFILNWHSLFVVVLAYTLAKLGLQFYLILNKPTSKSDYAL